MGQKYVRQLSNERVQWRFEYPADSESLSLCGFNKFVAVKVGNASDEIDRHVRSAILHDVVSEETSEIVDNNGSYLLYIPIGIDEWRH